MTPVAETLNPALEDKLSAFLVKLLKLGPDVSLTPEGDLIQQIGMDSIEAFDAVATLHELLEAAIPDDFDPRVVSTVRGLATYVSSSFGTDMVKRFLAMDLDRCSVFEQREDL